jgi:CBS domain-containing protein
MTKGRLVGAQKPPYDQGRFAVAFSAAFGSTIIAGVEGAAALRDDAGTNAGAGPGWGSSPMTRVYNTDAADKLAVTARTILDEKGSNVFTISAGASVYDAVAKMDECRVGALFVVDGDALVGVISERDYTRKIILQGRSSRETTVAEIMSSPVVSVEPTTTLGQCMHIINDRNVRHLAVVDCGNLAGVISIGDLVHAIVSLQAQTIDTLNTVIRDPYPH